MSWAKIHQGVQFFPFGESGFFICSQCVFIQFSTCFSNFQCVPQHTPNNTSLYPISFALSSILVTYIINPKEEYYNISILKLLLLSLIDREMHPSFESLVITNTLGLQTFFMDIYHDTSLRCILKDDSIFSTSIAYIHFYLKKGARLWLVITPSICSFHIAHFIFTLALHFRFDLI